MEDVNKTNMKYDNLYPLNTFTGKTRVELENMVDNLLARPYDVSEWEKTGIERGYWDYFRSEIVKEIEEKLPEEMEHPENESDEWKKIVSEHNGVLYDVKKILNTYK